MNKTGTRRFGRHLKSSWDKKNLGPSITVGCVTHGCPPELTAPLCAAEGHGNEKPRSAIPGNVTGNLPCDCNSPNNALTALNSELVALEYVQIYVCTLGKFCATYGFPNAITPLSAPAISSICRSSSPLPCSRPTLFTSFPSTMTCLAGVGTMYAATTTLSSSCTACSISGAKTPATALSTLKKAASARPCLKAALNAWTHSPRIASVITMPTTCLLGFTLA